MLDYLSIMLLSVTLKTNNSIMPKIMLEKQNYAPLIFVIIDALFHPSRQRNTPIRKKHNILLHHLHLCKQYMTNNAQKRLKCLISMEISIVRILLRSVYTEVALP